MAGPLLALVAAAAVTLAVGVGVSAATPGNGASAEHSNSGEAHSTAPGQQSSSSSTTTSTTTTGSSQGKGANQSGPYDPSGVGLPSGNGKSESNNGKRPCAGCVGKADAKNPPGQLPGGQDHNRGYECDQNQGVGKTNPAHSGCTSGGGGSSENPPGENPSASVVPPSEGAQAPGQQDEGGQLGEHASGSNNPTTRSFSGNPIHNVGDRLPFTGLGLALMALTGLAMTGFGRVLHGKSRVATPSGREDAQAPGEEGQEGQPGEHSAGEPASPSVTRLLLLGLSLAILVLTGLAMSGLGRIARRQIR